MKLNNLFNNRSFIAILALLILISGFSCSNLNLGNQNNQALDIIQNQLDDLICKLEKNNLKDIQTIPNENSQNANDKTNSIIKSLDFSEEVIEAFQSLNHDFLEYENILSSDSNGNNQNDFSEEKDRIKSLYHQNEENFKKICNLHKENQSNNEDISNKTDSNNKSFNKKYFEEIESLTNDISMSFDTFDKLEKIEENKEILKEKLAMIQEMKEKISDMKQRLDLIKNKKNALSEKRQKIKEISEKILGLYNKYLHLEKTINLKAKVDLEKLKNMMAESHKSDEYIKKYFSVYDEFIKFFNKISIQKNDMIEQSKVEEIKDKFESLGKFISKINASDNISSDIR